MIRVQLCPEDELESQFWYWPDVTVAVVVALVGYLTVQFYFDEILLQVDAANQEAENFKQSYNELLPDIQKFNNLEKDKAELTKKLSSLKSITVSKISKFKPLIVMEHFQNLKPQGVWYNSLEIQQSGQFIMEGQALDNILVAELMTSLISTKSTEAEENDLRSQIYFDGIKLDQTEIQAGPVSNFPNLKDVPKFNLNGKFRERRVRASQPNGPISSTDIRKDTATF